MREDRRLLVEIKANHPAKREACGGPWFTPRSRPRVCALARRGWPAWRAGGIQAEQQREFKATTYSRHTHPLASNPLARHFEANAPNQKGLADITYVPTREGWLHLAAIRYLPSRMVVGWAMSGRMSGRAKMERSRLAA